MKWEKSDLVWIVENGLCDSSRRIKCLIAKGMEKGRDLKRDLFQINDDQSVISILWTVYKNNINDICPEKCTENWPKNADTNRFNDLKKALTYASCTIHVCCSMKSK